MMVCLVVKPCFSQEQLIGASRRSKDNAESQKKRLEKLVAVLTVILLIVMKQWVL
jgi:hypothetical protein